MVLKWFALLPALAAVNAQDDGVQVVYEEVDGQYQLRHEVVVEAEAAEVWDLFTTEEGVTSWITPVAFIDFRVGGVMETSYNPGAEQGDPGNIKARFESIEPLKRFTSRNIQSPPETGFGPILKDLLGTIALKPEGAGKLRVIITMTGWQDTPEHQKVREFFVEGNRWYCNRLVRRLKEGPLSWDGTH